VETRHNDTKNDNKKCDNQLYADCRYDVCRYDECRGASLTSWIPYTGTYVVIPFTSVMYKCS
jgi:hypothetical protein